MVLKWRDYCGTYRIIKHRDGSATLVCRDRYGFLTHKKKYISVRGAKIALGRFCGGMDGLEACK